MAESGARNVDSLQDKLASAQTERDKAVMRAERLNAEVKKLSDEVNVLKKVIYCKLLSLETASLSFFSL